MGEHCLNERSTTKYQSICEAKHACNKDFDCGIVYDLSCDGKRDGIYTCPKSARVKNSVLGACIYRKTEGREIYNV